MVFTLLTAKLFSLMWPSLVRKIPGVSPLRFTQMKLILNGNGQQEGLKTRNSVKYFKITFIRIDNIYRMLLYWATIIIFDIYIHIRELYLCKWRLWGLWSQSCKIYNRTGEAFYNSCWQPGVNLNLFNLWKFKFYPASLHLCTIKI